MEREGERREKNPFERLVTDKGGRGSPLSGDQPRTQRLFMTLSFNLIKRVLTTILLTGTHTKKVFKLSTAKNRPGSVFRANLWALRLFSEGIRTSQRAPIIL